jgi:DNA invertase Pin-like site-specific DNA recombinase
MAKQPVCAIYARVSTDDHGQDPRNQLRDLRRYARSKNWSVVQEYVDHASGKNGRRQQFQAMLEDARRRKFDVLLFWSLDRITREGTFKTMCYLQHFSEAGVKYQSLQEQYIDTVGSFGDVVISLLATFAKLERDRISERTKAGLRRVQASGVRLGRRPRNDIDMIEVATLRTRGVSYREIATKFKCHPVWLCRKYKASKRSSRKR